MIRTPRFAAAAVLPIAAAEEELKRLPGQAPPLELWSEELQRKKAGERTR